MEYRPFEEIHSDARAQDAHELVSHEEHQRQQRKAEQRVRGPGVQRAAGAPPAVPALQRGDDRIHRHQPPARDGETERVRVTPLKTPHEQPQALQVLRRDGILQRLEQRAVARGEQQRERTR